MESSFLGNTRPFFQGVPSESSRGGYEARHQNERSINAPSNSTPVTLTLPHAHSQQYRSYPAVATLAQSHIQSRSMTSATPYTATFSDPLLLDPHRHNTRPPDISPDSHRTSKTYIHHPISERLTTYSSPAVGTHLYNSQPSATITSRGDTRTYSTSISSVTDNKNLYSTPSSTTIDSQPHRNLYVDPRIHMDPRYPSKHLDSRLNNPRAETIKALDTRPPDPWAPYPKHQYTIDPKVAYNSKALYGFEGKPSVATISSSVQTPPTNVIGSKEALYHNRRLDIIPKNVNNMYKQTHDNLINGSRDAIYPNGSHTCDNKYTSDPRYITEQYTDNKPTNSIKQTLDFRSLEAQNSIPEHLLEGRHSTEGRSTIQCSRENENRPIEDSVLDLSVKTVKQIPDSTAPDNEKATPPVTSDKNATQPDSFRRPSTSDSANPTFRPRDVSPGHVDHYRSTYSSHHVDVSKIHSHSGVSITGVQRSTPPTAPQVAHSSHPLGSPPVQHPRVTPPHHAAHTIQPRTTPPIHSRSATPNQIRTPPTHAPSPLGINGSASPLLPGSPSPRSIAMLPPSKRPGDPYLDHYSKYARLNNTSPVRSSVMSPTASLPSPQDKNMHMLKRDFSSDPNRGLHLLAAATATIKKEQDYYITEQNNISSESGDTILDKNMSLDQNRELYLERRDSSYSRSHSVERKEMSNINIDTSHETKDVRSISRDSYIERNNSLLIKRESASENEAILEKRDTLHGLDSRGVSVEKRYNIPVTSTDQKYSYRHSPYGPHSGWMTAPDPTTINSLPHERQKYQASQHLIQQHPTGYHHSSPSTAAVTVSANILSSPATYPYLVDRKPQSPRSAPPPISSPRGSSHQSSYPQTTESRLPTHTLSYSHSGATQVHSVQVNQHHTSIAKMHHQAYVSTGSRLSPIASTVSPSSKMSGPSQLQMYPNPYTHSEAQHYQHLQPKYDAHLHHKHPLHQEKHYHQHSSSIQHHQKQVGDRGSHYGKYNKTSVPQASPQTSSAAPGQLISHHSYPYLHHQQSDTHPSYSTLKRHSSPHHMTSHSDTGPTHPGTSSAHPGIGSVHPGTGSAHPRTSSTHISTHPSTGLAHPSIGPIQPGRGSAHPGGSTSHPGASIAHPGTGSAHPVTSTAHPGANTAHPSTDSVHSGTVSANPGSSSANPGTSSAQPISGSAHPVVSLAQSGGDLSHPSNVSASHGVSSTHPGTGPSHPGISSSHIGVSSAHPSADSVRHGTGSAQSGGSSAQSGGISAHPNTVSKHPDAGSSHSESELAHSGGGSTLPGLNSSHSGADTVLKAASHHNSMVPPGQHYSQHRRSSYLAAPQRSPASSALHLSQSHQPSISQSSYTSNYPYSSTGGISGPSATSSSSSQSGPHLMTHSTNQPSIPGQMSVHSLHHPRHTAAPHPNQVQTNPIRSYSGLPHSHRAHHVMPSGHLSAHSGVPSSYPKPHSQSVSESRSVTSQPSQLSSFSPHAHPQHSSHPYAHPRHTTPHIPGSNHPQASPQSHPHTQQAPAHSPSHGPPHNTSYVTTHAPPHSHTHGPTSSVHMTHPSVTAQSLQPPSHPEHLHYPSHKSSNPNPPYSSNHPLHSTHISHTSHSSPYAKHPMSSPSSRIPASYSQPGVPYQYPRMPPSKPGQSPQYHSYPTYPHPHSHHHPHMTSYSDRSTGPSSIDTDPSRIKTKGEQKAFDPRNVRQWSGGPWHSGPHSSTAPFGPYPTTTNIPTSAVTPTQKTYAAVSQSETVHNIKQEVLSQEESAKSCETSQCNNKSLEPGKAALAHKLHKKLSRTDSGDNHLLQKLHVEKQEIKDDKKESNEEKWDFSFDKLMDDLAANRQGCVSRKSKTLAKRYEQKIQIQHAIENDLIIPTVQPIVEESDSEPEAPVKFRGKFKSIKDKAVERVILTYASHSDDSATEMIPDDDASDFEAELEREIRAERKRGKRGHDKKQFHSVSSGSDKGRKSNAKHKLKHGKNKENKPNNKQDSDFTPSISSGSDSSSSDDCGTESEESDLEEIMPSRGRNKRLEKEEITSKKVKGRRPKWQTDSSESEDYIPRRKGKKSKKVLSDEDNYQPTKKSKRLPKVDTSDSEEEIKPKRRKKKESLDSDYEEDFEYLKRGKKKISPAKHNTKVRKDVTDESESDDDNGKRTLGRKKHQYYTNKGKNMSNVSDDSSVSGYDSKTLVIGKRRLKTNQIESSIDSEEELISKASKSGKVKSRNEKYSIHPDNVAKHKNKSKHDKPKHSDSSTESDEYKKIENKLKLKKKKKYKVGSDADSDAVTSSKSSKIKKIVDSESDMDIETKDKIKNVPKSEDDMLDNKIKSETMKGNDNIVEDDLIEDIDHKEPDSVLEKIEKLRQKEQGREDVQEMKLWMEEMSQEMERQLKPFQDTSDIRHYYKKPQFGNESDFPHGWESEVKSYKESIARIPKDLCIAVPFSATLNAMSNKNNSKKSRERDVVKDSPSSKGSSPAKNTRSNSKGIIKTSMALADGENLSVAARPEISSDMQRFFEKVLSDNVSDSKVISRRFSLSPFSSYLARSPTGLTPSPSVAPSMLASDDSDLDSLASIRMDRPASDSYPIGKRSIANSLMKKLQQKYNNKKFNTQWLNKPRSILEATNKPQLLPTPGMPTTEKDLEKMDPSQLKLATFFRKETVINYRDNFEVVVTKNGMNEFSPKLYKARTRNKTKENEDAATINAVFGADIPKHILHRRKQEIQKIKKKDHKKLLDKKHDIGKSTSSPIGISRPSTPADCTILDDDVEDDDEDDDDSEIASERSQSVLRMITLVPPSNTKKVRRKFRKFRSGFDYIRKTKKKKPDEEPTPIKRKLAVRKHVLWPEQSRDVAGEVRTWVVNKGLGETVLHKAARLQYHDVVIYCVENPMDFDINVRDNAGYTPLHEACNRGHLDIAQILCAHGAQVNAPGYGGMRPLHEAVENGHGELARLLLSYGADPALTTYAGQTVLALAEESHCKSFIEGYLADLKGAKGEMWHFIGPTGFLDIIEQGFNIFSKVPRSLFDLRRRHLMRSAPRKRRQIRNVQCNIGIMIKEEKIDDKDNSISPNHIIDNELVKMKEETKLVHIKQEVEEREYTEELVDKEFPVKSTHSDINKNENEGLTEETQSKLDIKDEKPNILSHNKKEIDSEEEAEEEEDFMSFTFECSLQPIPEIYHVYGHKQKYLLLKELLVYLDFNNREELIIAAGNIETIELSSEQFMRLAHGCVLGSCSRRLVENFVSIELVKLTNAVEKLLDVELVKL